MTRSTIAKPVIIDGVAYKSLSKAEKILGISKGFLSLLKNKGRTEFKGMKLDFGKNAKISRLCRVYSPTLDKYFKSISKAAKYAGVDDWTMSKKMETAGEFIDKDNIRYIRLNPMNTKNQYENTGSTLQKIRKTKKCRIEKQITEPCPVFIKDAISQYIKQLIKDSGVWEKICEAMDYCKINEFKIKKD